MKKLLHLYNYGHNPFPKIGRGGLGYHLQQYRLRGGMLNPDIPNPIIETENSKYDYTDAEGIHHYIVDMPFKYEDPKKTFEISRFDPKFEKEYEEYAKNYEDYMGDYKYTKNTYEEDEEEERVLKSFSNTLKDKHYDELQEEYEHDMSIILNKIMKLTKEDLIMMLAQEGIIVENQYMTKTNIIKTFILNDSSLRDLFYDIASEKDKEKTEGGPAFVIPDNELKILTASDIKPIIDTELISPDESYSDVVNNINNYSKKSDIYNSLYPNFKLIKEPIDFKKTFALEFPVKDLTINVDGTEYKPKGGIDFELKVKDNMPFFKSIVEQYLGNEATIISVKPDDTGYDKADYVIEVKINGEEKSIFIDLELKKYMTEQGIKGQDLVAYKNKSAFDSIDKINEGTSKMFNNWFYEFKNELRTLYRICKLNNNFDLYYEKLNSVSSNNKFDSEKLLMQHVISGKYFSLPLTITKFKTPSREIINATMRKRYPKSDKHHEYEKLHTAVSDYIYGHWKRFNPSDNILIPVLLINDGMLSMNVRKKFGNLIPFEVLQIVNNIYSHDEKDALGLPACFLSNVNLPNEALLISSERSKKELSEEYRKEILEKKEAQKNKPQTKTKSKKSKIIDL